MTNWTQYVAAFGDFTGGYCLTHPLHGFFNNAGSTAYAARAGGFAEDAAGDATGAGPTPLAVPGASAEAALPAAGPEQLGTFAVTADTAGRSGPQPVEVADPKGEGPAERLKPIGKDGDKPGRST